MQCDELAERLTDFLEGDLDPETEEEAIEHLATCDHCEVVLSKTREVTKLAHDHGRVTIGEADRDRLFDGIASRLRSDRRS